MEKDNLKNEKQCVIHVVSHSCSFKQYGEEERLCTKCDYVIGGKGDINKMLEFMINNGYSMPKCGVNNYG